MFLHIKKNLKFFFYIICSILGAFYFNYFTFQCDYPMPYQVTLQDSATPVMESIVNFYHDLMVFIVFIAAFVGVILLYILWRFSDDNNLISQVKINKETGLAEGLFSYKYKLTFLEIVWTVLPTLIIFTIAMPSFSLLYSLDDVSPCVTIKVLGAQWYWTYEYWLPQYDIILKSESYMLMEDMLTKGDLRLLEVDMPLYVPVRTPVRFVVTSLDVLHSWAIPSLGIKIDAIPGRLNQVLSLIQRPGVYFGQCSELCGLQHGFMPIVLLTVTMDEYLFPFRAYILSELLELCYERFEGPKVTKQLIRETLSEELVKIILDVEKRSTFTEVDSKVNSLITQTLSESTLNIKENVRSNV